MSEKFFLFLNLLHVFVVLLSTIDMSKHFIFFTSTATIHCLIASLIVLSRDIGYSCFLLFSRQNWDVICKILQTHLTFVNSLKSWRCFGQKFILHLLFVLWLFWEDHFFKKAISVIIHHWFCENVFCRNHSLWLNDLSWCFFLSGITCCAYSLRKQHGGVLQKV